MQVPIMSTSNIVVFKSKDMKGKIMAWNSVHGGFREMRPQQTSE